MPIQICPSILNANFDDLPNEIRRVEATSDFLHLDVMDGVFVPRKTFDLAQAEELVKGTSLKTDAHLMIANPDLDAPKYGEIGCFSVTFHFEAARKPQQILRDIRKTGARSSIGLKPDTDIDVISGFLADIDMILIMTVEPGAGGQSFMADMMPKVRRARELIGSDKIWLQVDGGISIETIEIARSAGADTFVAGSAVYRDPNPAQMVERLRKLATAVSI